MQLLLVFYKLRKWKTSLFISADDFAWLMKAEVHSFSGPSGTTWTTCKSFWDQYDWLFYWANLHTFWTGIFFSGLLIRSFKCENSFRSLDQIQAQIGMMWVWEQGQFYSFYQYKFLMQKLSTMNSCKTIVSYEVLFGFYQPLKCQ